MTHARQEKEELMGSPFSIPNDNFQDLESVGLRRLKTKHCSHETDELGIAMHYVSLAFACNSR